MTQAHLSQAVRPVAEPTTTIATRKRIEDAIERLMLMLEAIDDDPDFEPSLGWPDPFSWWRFSNELGTCDDTEMNG